MHVKVCQNVPESLPRISDLGIPLVRLVGKLLGVGVVFADADEVDLQLERPVGFVSEGECDGVHLWIQTHGEKDVTE